MSERRKPPAHLGKPRTAQGQFARRRWPVRWARLLGRIPDMELARRMGTTSHSVRAERLRRGIPPAIVPKHVKWSVQALALLGKTTDREIAQELKTSPTTVSIKRRSLGIPCYEADQRPRPSRLWTKRAIALLGTMSDSRLAKRIGTVASVVCIKRRTLGIPAFGPIPKRIRWTKAMLAMIGKLPDMEIARRLHLHAATIKHKREALERREARRAKRRSKPNLETLLATYGNYQLWRRFGMRKPDVDRLRFQLGIRGPDRPGHGRRLSPEILARLGKETDLALAKEAGVSGPTIGAARNRLGIPALKRGRWEVEEEALLGILPDRLVAERLGKSKVVVAMKRRALGIAAVIGPRRRSVPER